MKALHTIIEYFADIFRAEDGRVSSKRVAGFAAWACVLTSYVFCSIHELQLPTATDMIVWASSAMMGIDSVMKPFCNKGKNK